jgi:cysteine desulfurase
LKYVNMDHLSASPLDPRVLEVMMPYFLENYGNPMSTHSLGQEASLAITTAREHVAALINARPKEIVFTASGSEANNTAVVGTACCPKKPGTEILVSGVEHSSVLHTARDLARQGVQARILPVDKHGMVDPDDVKKFVSDRTALVSVMHSNGEVGTIQPIAEISRITREAGIPLHTDAVASTGLMSLDVDELGVDLMSISAQGLYGPKGAGAVYVRKGTRMRPFIIGGVQEDGRRAGLTDVPAVVGFGEAARLTLAELDGRIVHLKHLGDRLIDGVLGSIPDVQLNGHPEERLPGHAAFGILYVEGESLVLSLDMEGFLASTGSACVSRALKSSHVLAAMGLPPEVSQSSLQFTLGKDNSEDEVDNILEVLPGIVDRLRKMSPLKSGLQDRDLHGGDKVAAGHA